MTEASAAAFASLDPALLCRAPTLGGADVGEAENLQGNVVPLLRGPRGNSDTESYLVMDDEASADWAAG